MASAFPSGQLATRPTRFPVDLRCHRPCPDGFRFVAPTRASIPESAVSLAYPREGHNRQNDSIAIGAQGNRNDLPRYVPRYQEPNRLCSLPDLKCHFGVSSYLIRRQPEHDLFWMMPRQLCKGTLWGQTPHATS